MTGVVPPSGQAPPPAATPGASPVPVEAGVESLPPRLSDGQRPVAVTGTVVESRPSPEGGAVSRIRTAAGEVVLRTETPLPAGPVTVQLPPGRPPTQATVQLPPTALPAAAAPPAATATTVQPLQPATTVALATAGAAPPALPSVAVPVGGVVPPPALAVLLPGMSVRAQVLAAAPGAGPPLPAMPGTAGSAAATPGTAGLPAARPGTAGLPASMPGTAGLAAAMPGTAGLAASMPAGVGSLPGTGPLGSRPGAPQGQAGTVMLPASLAGTAGGASPPGGEPAAVGMAGMTVASAAGPVLSGQGAAATGTPGGTAAGASAGGSAAPASTEGSIVGPAGIGTLRVLSVGDSPARAAIGGGPVTVATVTGAQVGGQPVVATDRGLLVLQAHPGLPAGTRLTLETLPPPAPTTLPRLAPLDPMGSRDWPALQHALDAMAQSDPQSARAVTAAILPQINARLATNMALFMGIVRGGVDPRAWIGDRGVRALEAAGRAELVDRLAEDLRGLQRQAEGGGGEWRTYPLPLLHDGVMDRVVVRVRRREDDEEGEAERVERRGGGTRFLVDVNLSRLGPLQLDGLVRPKRLDLIVRSRDALPESLRTELRQIYAGAMADLRLAGDLGFQSGRAIAWVPLPGHATSGRGVVA
jgi:hypothetical protein